MCACQSQKWTSCKHVTYGSWHALSSNQTSRPHAIVSVFRSEQMVILLRSWPPMLSCWRTDVHRFLNDETIFVPPVLPSTRSSQTHSKILLTSSAYFRFQDTDLQLCESEVLRVLATSRVIDEFLYTASAKTEREGSCNTSCVSLPREFCRMVTEGDVEKARTMR